MKHYFVLNPNAGFEDSTKYLIPQIEQAFSNRTDTYEIYLTKGIGDAKNYVQSVCKRLSEPTRFYAGGGDGTVNEVASGLVGCKHAAMGIIPVGSCCDFVKSLKDRQFKDIERQITGDLMEVDIIKVNDHYSINVANIGFDSNVVERAALYRHKMPVKKAYDKSILWNLLFHYDNEFTLTIEDEVVYSGKYLLTAFANGTVYGGGYYCAPTAKTTDGLIDVVMVRKIPRYKFIKLIKVYKEGRHLSDPRLSNIVSFYQCKKAKVTSKTPMNVSLDGELYKWTEVNVHILEKAIKVIIPRK